jgi:hypothetical protein
MDRNEFQEDQKINPEELDLEAAEQAEKFFKWAERAVEARETADQAKFTMEVLAAQLKGEAMMDPEKFGLKKTTVEAVNAAVQSWPAYTKAQQEYLEARKVSALMDQAVSAMEQRKRMIEVLVTLHGQQYFAGPSVPRNLVDAWKESQQKKEENVNKKQVSRARKRQKKEG